MILHIIQDHNLKKTLMAYLEKVDNVDIDDDKRLVDEMNDTVANGDVGFDHLGDYNASRMMEIAHKGVGLHVDCVVDDREKGAG